MRRSVSLLQRLLGVKRLPPPKLIEIMVRIDDLDARMDYLDGGLRKLRGTVTGALRRPEPESDAPSAVVFPPELYQGPPRLAPPLKRVMRGF